MLAGRWLVEANHLAVQARCRRRIGLGYAMVVAGDDEVARAGQPLDAPIALEHAGQIVENGERALLVDLLEDVHGVGGENDPAAGRIDPNDGLAAGMAANE